MDGVVVEGNKVGVDVGESEVGGWRKTGELEDVRCSATTLL